MEQNNGVRGQIIGNISDLYKIKYNSGYINCKARGIFKKDNLKPLVGDNVIFDPENEIITELLPRKNELVRPPICNIDQALIVMSVEEPKLDFYLLDKMISIISYNNINVIICFTKLDLLDQSKEDEINEYIKYYKKIGYKVVINNQLEEVYKLLKNKITAITGQSGVGKSSLLNRLDKNLNLKTAEISHALGRGKHTTRHVELIEIGDCLIADTPGFSSLDFYNMNKEDIRNSMIEFTEYMDDCKYRDCFHLKEDGCKIKELVSKGIILSSRYSNYKKFIQEEEDANGKDIRFRTIKKQ
ncbi:MAG: ribosome small subunit-dependent GTPase A [Bacilli bacterium]|nr:ribosome small subunit-dependent GTPase A [Bacilli bacterium]MDD3305149.1 ribosome small subunit-dependent GTPase A [Bacilli bacterium]MDD4053667.1 ribosome small subunit-dependent GTPase A [Bacilli bacterium]MDD4411166.1 ribosome small subunit-dependent GTPase A [Bacilli bacterium]